MSNELTQLTILWLTDLSNTESHKYSNDLLAAIDLVSEMKRRLKHVQTSRTT